jgi:DNA-binding GntR family transcriptional regulator
MGLVSDPETPAERTFLGDRVVRALRGMIATGELAPGERIVERDVAEQLGTSRGPVREAIRTLEHEGLVEARPYASACVARIDRDEIDEIFALRRQVEYFAIAGATLRAEPHELDALRAMAEQMREAFAAGDAQRLLDVDLAFHLAICEASHHATLSVTMRTLYPRLAILFFPQMFRSQENFTADSFAQQHLDLVDAIESGDVERSLAAMDAHLDSFYVDVQLRINGGTPRRQPAYLRRHRPDRPVAVRRRLGAS